MSFAYDVGPGVAATDLALIQQGIATVQAELDADFGGDQMRPVGQPLVVKVVADGSGNQEPGGKGACCTALNAGGARIFIDTKHPGWADAPDWGRRHAAGHEYVHTWQNALGCVTYLHQPLGDWTNEGIAEYVSYLASIRAGEMSADAVRYAQYQTAEARGQLAAPLETMDTPGDAHPWPGNVGHLAIEYLLAHAPLGNLAVKAVCTASAGGATPDGATLAAFGQTRAALYRDFPAYLRTLPSSPVALGPAVQLPSGSVGWVPAGGVAYTVSFFAWGWDSLTSAQQGAAFTTTPQHCGWAGDGIGRITVGFCTTPASPIAVRLEMPDGRTGTLLIGAAN